MLFVTNPIVSRGIGSEGDACVWHCTPTFGSRAAVMQDDEGVWKKCQRTSELAGVCHCTHHLGDALRNRLGLEETGL